LGRGGFPFIHYRQTCTDGIGEALLAISRNSCSLLDFPEFAQAVRYGVLGTLGLSAPRCSAKRRLRAATRDAARTQSPRAERRFLVCLVVASWRK
jgi:hypothetical protein